jgi:hypothetical protein
VCMPSPSLPRRFQRCGFNTALLLQHFNASNHFRTFPDCTGCVAP